MNDWWWIAELMLTNPKLTGIVGGGLILAAVLFATIKVLGG